jgi:hypothetical protein
LGGQGMKLKWDYDGKKKGRREAVRCCGLGPAVSAMNPPPQFFI